MWSSSLHWHIKWHEKVALREAEKEGTVGIGKGIGKANTQNLLGSGACTCNCICPVHNVIRGTAPDNGFGASKASVIGLQKPK